MKIEDIKVGNKYYFSFLPEKSGECFKCICQGIDKGRGFIVLKSLGSNKDYKLGPDDILCEVPEKEKWWRFSG